MATLFSDLLAFFGISASAPQNLSELFPWLLSILIAMSVFLFVFGMVKDFVKFFGRGRF